METVRKKDIRALSLEDLRGFFVNNNDKAFRGNQVYQWLWQKGIHDFEGMTNLSIETRSLLEEHFVINNIAIDRQQKSIDGTLKNAVKLFDNLIVESVLIPTATRTTACVMNYKHLMGSIAKITQPDGLGMSPSRITISTSGIPKMIKKLADENIKFGLAVSLHSARQEVREQLMPFAEKFPLTDLADSLKYWYEATSSLVTYEYVVWKDINDKQEDIDALVKFCMHVPCKVNLIEYNPLGDDTFKQADISQVEKYQKALERVRITATIRRSRGKDIDAACGQLANKTEGLSS